MIVARLSYDADERDLEREFGRFGPIERVGLSCPNCVSLPIADHIYLQIRIISDTHIHEKPQKKKKPHRGYAFVVFEREKDMRGKLLLIPLRKYSSPLDVPWMVWPSSLPTFRSIL